MGGFLFKRILATIPVMVIVAVIVFTLIRMVPGDPAAVIAGNMATNEDIARIRTELGLDRSFLSQFGIWAKGLLSGDLGQSFFFKKEVSSIIADRVGATLSLAFLTIVITVLVAVPLGTLAAWKHGGWLDRALMGFSVLGFSIPVFILGYLLVYFFALKLDWFPVQGYKPLADGFWNWLHHLLLPAITLSIVYVALIARVTRASVAESLTEDYVRTARAKGLPESRVLLKHALANAAVPIVTVIGIGIALLIGGVVVTESVYSIPGLGTLTVDAVLARDFPVIQGVILFFAFLYVMVNLLVDISYLFLDPRIRY
ncbi:MAG: ABC transporter permease [Betaproteobacteria bacterium]|nr:MAG: ABC transporter permease [Betaproteobacteria bacterium]